MIRSYGPGKFNTIIDSYVYDLSLDGCDEELGDVSDFNHYCRVSLGRQGLKDIAHITKGGLGEEDRGRRGLTLEEARRIRRSVGAIVETNDQGSVNVEYFPTKKSYDKEWARIEKEYDEFYEGRED